MKLFYYRAPRGNFGDDLNEWFWDQVLPGWRAAAPEHTLVGIGTILNRDILPKGGRKVVMGSGVGYGRIPDLINGNGEWDLRFVRGPLTAHALNLPKEKGISDPAVLVSDLEEFQAMKDAKAGGTIFVPNYASDGFCDWSRVLAGTGITLVGATDESRQVIHRILSADLVIAESMHAAIIADTFRVPWTPVAITGDFLYFKWRDWMSSVGVEASIVDLLKRERWVFLSLRRALGRVAPSSLEWEQIRVRTEGTKRKLPKFFEEMLCKRFIRVLSGPSYLSKDYALRDVKEKLWSALDGFQRDYAQHT